MRLAVPLLRDTQARSAGPVVTRKRESPGTAGLHSRGRAITMTLPNNSRGQATGKCLPLSHHQRSMSDGERQACILLESAKRGEGSSTAWQATGRRTTSRRRATSIDGPPRVLESTAKRVLHLERSGSGTRQAQRAPCRAVRPEGSARRRPASRGWPGRRRAVRAVRAVDVSRPGAPVMRRAVSSADVRTSDRRDPPPSLFGPLRHAACPNRGGVHHPPTLPSRGARSNA